MSKIIVIDFDDTLFNTTVLRNDIKDELRRLGIGPDLFERTYQKIKDLHGYNLYLHLMLLASDYNLDMIKAKKSFDGIMKQLNRYLFDDATQFLSKLKDRGHFSVIYTYGNKIFQQDKLKACDMDDQVDDVFITPKENKLDLFFDYYNKDLDKILFIDNNPDILMNVNTLFPQIEVVQVARQKQAALPGMKCVYNLNDIDV